MAKKKAGTRHKLLFYQYFWGRLWKPTLLLGGLLALIWAAGDIWGLEILDSDLKLWILLGAGVSLFFALIALVARRLSYVQARADHLRLTTAFFPLRISYRRIVSTRASAFNQLFPSQEESWAQRRFLDPFYGATVIVVEMRGTPMHPAVMRLFLSKYMFLSQPPRLVLLVPNWMSLSAEIDSYIGAWRQAQAYQEHVRKRGRLNR
jgi:hypothetical protein